MAGVTVGELTALADGRLPPSRRAAVEAAVAASPALAALLAEQRRALAIIDAAVKAAHPPQHLGNPEGPPPP